MLLYMYLISAKVHKKIYTNLVYILLIYKEHTLLGKIFPLAGIVVSDICREVNVEWERTKEKKQHPIFWNLSYT